MINSHGIGNGLSVVVKLSLDALPRIKKRAKQRGGAKDEPITTVIMVGTNKSSMI